MKFLGALDPHSIQANSLETLRVAAWSGADAVYSSWLALLMPMLMRTVRSGEETGVGYVAKPSPKDEEVEM
jgi:hypothetical protein